MLSGGNDEKYLLVEKKKKFCHLSIKVNQNFYDEDVREK